jgi:hypothetical protein
VAVSVTFKLDVDPAAKARIQSSIDSKKTLLQRLTDAIRGPGAQIITDWIKYGLLSGRVLKNRTGNLRDSIKTANVPYGVKIYQDESMAPYGKFHEYGVSHPWIIKARNYPYGSLKFTVGGKTVFAKWVRHPGLPIRSFMDRGITDKTPALMTYLTSFVKRTA